ncbi:MAG TPA: LysR substrate-binding domain-containing protein [Dehalococcoidia bacterium]|nr:LysR substrate-binding domain-containing protein [Dehalococcoidia bacterium]
MELRHLRYFVAVGEELHFARAAVRLKLAQPPLSKQIRQLEQELGVRLLERTTRSVSLTSAGKVFLDEARRVLAQAERARSMAMQAQLGAVGELQIGFVTSVGYELLPDMLRAYRARFPRVQIRPYHMTVGEQIKALEERRLHIGVVRRPFESEMLAFEVIRQEPVLLSLPEGHPLAQHEVVEMRELAGESFIAATADQRTSADEALDRVFHETGFRSRVVQEAPDILTILGLVAAGIGVSLVPAAASRLRTSGVVYRPLAGDVPLHVTALAWRRDEGSAAVAGFLEAARAYLRGENELDVTRNGTIMSENSGTESHHAS